MPIVTYEANKSRVFIDGAEVKLLTDFTQSDNYALESVSGIGDIHVLQHAPTVARHEVRFSGYVKKPETLMSSGVIPENGDIALVGRTFTIEVFDKDGPLLRRYEDCMCNNGEARMQRHGLLMKDAVFYAIDAKGAF